MITIKYHESQKNNHYFYVMGWDNENMINAPIYKNKYDIYDDAVKFFKKLEKLCKFVSMFEMIGGKRKWIADSHDASAVR